MAANREFLQIEPGEIVPFGQFNELEPGEIRPGHVPMQLQTATQTSAYYTGVQYFTVQPCWNGWVQTQSGFYVNQQVSSQSFQTQYNEDVGRRQDDKIKTLQDLIKEMKDTLEKEREERKADVVKIKSQTRKIRDLELRDKHQQKEIKELTKAKDVAEDVCKKTDEEKAALKAMMKSMEKEGCKISLALKTKEAKVAALLKDLKTETQEKSDEIALLKEKIKMIEDQKPISESNTERMNELEDEVAFFKSALEKASKKLKKESQVKMSLTQETELWKNECKQIEKEKEVICEQADQEKAALTKKIRNLKNKCCKRGKIIDSEKAEQLELQNKNKVLKRELKRLKKERDALSIENNFLQEENYNLRYYGGVIGSFRRVKRFFGRLADRLLS